MNKLVKQAFTLIELLVVIAIIGILSGLIVVGLSGMTDKANIAKAQVFSNSLRNSLMLNLISEWKLDQINIPAANKTPDSWGNNTGTLTDNGGACDSTHCPRQVNNCVYGNCLSFNGSSSYVSIGSPSNLNFSSALTVEAWVNFNSLDGWGTIIAGGCNGTNGYRFYISQSNHKIILETRDALANLNTIASLNPVITTGSWIYLVGTFTATGVGYVMVNGEKGTSISTPYSAAAPSGIVIGSCGGSQFLNGLIDEVRIYGIAIPAYQINAQYYAGLNSLLANGNITSNEYSQRIGEVASY